MWRVTEEYTATALICLTLICCQLCLSGKIITNCISCKMEFNHILLFLSVNDLTAIYFGQWVEHGGTAEWPP